MASHAPQGKFKIRRLHIPLLGLLQQRNGQRGTAFSGKALTGIFACVVCFWRRFAGRWQRGQQTVKQRPGGRAVATQVQCAGLAAAWAPGLARITAHRACGNGRGASKISASTRQITGLGARDTQVAVNGLKLHLVTSG